VSKGKKSRLTPSRPSPGGRLGHDGSGPSLIKSSVQDRKKKKERKHNTLVKIICSLQGYGGKGEKAQREGEGSGIKKKQREGKPAVAHNYWGNPGEAPQEQDFLGGK